MTFLFHLLALHLTTFCDANLGNNVDGRKSTSSYCIFLGNNLVSWSSKKQPVVARSSTEAKYKSLALTVMEIMWLLSLLQELKMPLKSLCDNISTILLTYNPILHHRTKHLEFSVL